VYDLNVFHAAEGFYKHGHIDDGFGAEDMRGDGSIDMRHWLPRTH
jgi:hypothetical protein